MDTHHFIKLNRFKKIEEIDSNIYKFGEIFNLNYNDIYDIFLDLLDLSR